MDDRPPPIEPPQPPQPPQPPRIEPPPAEPPAPRIEPVDPPPMREPGPEPPPVEPPDEPPPPRIEPVTPPADPARARSWLAEREETPVEVSERRLAAASRRDFLLFTAGALASAVGAWWLLPDQTRRRMLPEGLRAPLDALVSGTGLTRARRERTLERARRFDDDVAEALFSSDRRVRTYRRADITPLKNNYHGRTPGPEILAGWSLRVTGLVAGGEVRLSAADLLARFPFREQITRLVCVEGWSAVSWWGGVAFADLLAAYPPRPGARWAAMRSEVSLDARGNPEPYYVAIDLGTARHPQSLLVTHHLGRPLTLAHGAPLRLIAPVKLGLKNIKGLTDIAYVADPPPDYWAERGYSYFDGL